MTVLQRAFFRCYLCIFHSVKNKVIAVKGIIICVCLLAVHIINGCHLIEFCIVCEICKCCAVGVAVHSAVLAKVIVKSCSAVPCAYKFFVYLRLFRCAWNKGRIIHLSSTESSPLFVIVIFCRPRQLYMNTRR